MNKEIVKVIPDCIEKIGKFTPAKHREVRKTTIYTLPVAVLIVIIRYIHKERMEDKCYDEKKLQMEHEESMLQMEIEHKEKILQMMYDHEEKLAEIKGKLLSREEESNHEKDN